MGSNGEEEERDQTHNQTRAEVSGDERDKRDERLMRRETCDGSAEIRRFKGLSNRQIPGTANKKHKETAVHYDAGGKSTEM